MIMQERQGISPVVKGLLIANVAMYVLEIVPVVRNYVFYYGALIPRLAIQGFQIWRPITYMFLHDPSGVWHLLFNMLALWMFGIELEQLWGSRRFLWFYTLAGVGSALFSVIMWNSFIIGASGAIMAILTVYAVYFPERRVLFFFIFPLPVRVAVFIVGLISLIGSLGSRGGIAHLTHLGGIVIALLYLKFYPQVAALRTHITTLSQEKKARRNAEGTLARQRHFEEVIDPILKKISEQGMDSLTRKEKSELKKASQRNPEQMKKRKIIPFQSFK